MIYVEKYFAVIGFVLTFAVVTTIMTGSEFKIELKPNK